LSYSINNGVFLNHGILSLLTVQKLIKHLLLSVTLNSVTQKYLYTDCLGHILMLQLVSDVIEQR